MTDWTELFGRAGPIKLDLRDIFPEPGIDPEGKRGRGRPPGPGREVLTWAVTALALVLEGVEPDGTAAARRVAKELVLEEKRPGTKRESTITHICDVMREHRDAIKAGLRVMCFEDRLIAPKGPQHQYRVIEYTGTGGIVSGGAAENELRPRLPEVHQADGGDHLRDDGAVTGADAGHRARRGRARRVRRDGRHADAPLPEV